jgi:phosphoribosylamine--glycine ligase
MRFGHNVFCAPGSDAIALETSVFSFASFEELAQLIFEHKINRVVVGPEAYLADGVSDYLREYCSSVKVFGPTREAARLETDKSFSKQFMLSHSIPTARALCIFQDSDISEALTQFSPPFVVKAAGLAQGKGVWIGSDSREAKKVAEDFLKAHSSVVIEEFLSGVEMSAFYAIRGDQFIFLGSAQDHKRLLDGDAGPNTGGMGALSPSPLESSELLEQIEEFVVKPTLSGLRQDRIFYEGFLFVGLMLTQKGTSHRLSVLEFNCRMGDPETQCLLSRLDTDLCDVFQALENHQAMKVATRPGTALTVVVASAGYPERPQRGQNLGSLQCPPPLSILHSGTQKAGEEWIATGGRLFSVSSVQADLRLCQKQTYDWLSAQNLKTVHYRKDIGGHHQ